MNNPLSLPIAMGPNSALDASPATTALSASSTAPAKKSGGCGKCETCSCGDSSAPALLADQAHAKEPHQADSDNGALLSPPDHVLSTLEADGSRRWLRPKLAMGDWWKRRRVVAYALMVIFVLIPHLRVNGKPVVLLDFVSRQLTILGKTFYPTDTVILALLLLTVLLSIVLVTAIAGRAWCGWACPQTVYMEFLFRPIDRFFEGTRGKGGKPRESAGGLWQVARIGVYVLLCMFLAHTFLAYFVGTDKLAQWVRSSPLEQPTAFLVMAATTGLMLFDFLIFREQMCLIACPYGRFQSVMLDEQSKIVAYDIVRGEPRRKGKRGKDKRGEDEIASAPAGDCVDCNQCVVVCPTGIDIRNGLQMECINCTQCIDACDSVMEKVGKPKGLIRYSSQDDIARKPKKLLRARTIIYPLILVGVTTALAFAIVGKVGFDARLLRGNGAPFSWAPSGEITNSFKLRLVNRTATDQVYQIAIASPENATLEVVQEELLSLPSGGNVLIPISVSFPPAVTRGDGNEDALISIVDQTGNQRELDFKILGPR